MPAAWWSSERNMKSFKLRRIPILAACSTLFLTLRQSEDVHWAPSKAQSRRCKPCRRAAPSNRAADSACMRSRAAAVGRGCPRALGPVSGGECLTEAFELITMEPENQGYQCQQNKMCPETIMEAFSQPRLNEVDGAAFESDKVRMSGVWTNPRPPRNTIESCHLPQEIDAEQCEQELEGGRSLPLELPSCHAS